MKIKITNKVQLVIKYYHTRCGPVYMGERESATDQCPCSKVREGGSINNSLAWLVEGGWVAVRAV